MKKNTKNQVQRAFNAWINAFKKEGETDVDHVNDWVGKRTRPPAPGYGTLRAYEEWLDESTYGGVSISSSARVIKITGEVAAAVIASFQIDGRDDAALKFIEQQRYVKSGEACPKYVFVFDLGDKHNGCAILRGDDLTLIDLADLNDHPFTRLRSCGFLTLHVAHADHSLLDLDALQREIEHDLLYDRDEDELEISFSPNDDETVLSVAVYERSAEEIDEEREQQLT